MRRLTSAVAAAAISLAAVATSALPASAAAPGTVTETAAPSAIPTSLAGARITRITRLSRTGEFLVVGRANTSGSRYYMWQLKPDYTVDTTFGTAGVVDTGVSDSNCNTQYMNNNTNCSSVRTLAYNEVSGTYALMISRQIGGTSYVHTVNSVVIGDLKTGAIKSTSTIRDSNSGTTPGADTEFATLNITAQNLGRDDCTAFYGASVNGVNLTFASFNINGAYIVPNGSIIVSINCTYSNMYTANGSYASGTAVKEYLTAHLSAYKVVNGALVLDTTWGTAGRVGLNKADSGKCFNNMGSTATTDLGITTMASTKPYTIVPVSLSDRRTTVPTGTNFSSYEGCNTMGAGVIQYGTKLMALTANGTMTEALDLGTSTTPSVATRWVIDPAGRWVSLVRGVSSTPGAAVPYTAVRLINGKGDATFGTNGQKSLSLASTITVNGTSVTVSYSITGMITTQDEVLFTGFSTTLSQNSFMCNGSNPATASSTVRPFILSLKSGAIDTTYGTSGLGDASTYQFSEYDMCGGGWGSSTFVTSKGQPATLRARPAIGSQTAGVFAYVWESVVTATGGGDGGTGTGGATKDTGGAAFTGEKAFTAAAAAGSTASVAGRVDAKVYTTAPAKVQENSAVSVLKPSEADDLDLVSTTPKVCIALTTSVVFTGTGRCVVRIIDEETRKVIRNFATTVTKAEVTPGTVLTTNDPIMFRYLGTTLTTKATAQVKVLAESATTVGRILVVGHSASLYDNEVSNKRIALQRAAAVKAALIKAGVKAPISIVSVGSADPVATAKTEAAQAKNRRVEVFLFPATES